MEGYEEVINHVGFFAAPQIAEKTVKTSIAEYKSGFLPTISLKRPLRGVMTVLPSKYAVPTQEVSDGLA